MFRMLTLTVLMTALAGCASAGNMTPGQQFTMSVGESAALPDGAKLRYVKVLADSRCPPDVQCVRAGDADVMFEFTPMGGTATPVRLNIPEAPTAPIGNWRLELLALEFGHSPRATVRVDKP